ncbi:MAG: hypothetical protein QG584_1353 [Pseudomonadota bacterium]|jgi:hypothetical protein|nr:hypothetical protein [Pseudomonadota bacterium]
MNHFIDWLKRAGELTEQFKSEGMSDADAWVKGSHQASKEFGFYWQHVKRPDQADG